MVAAALWLRQPAQHHVVVLARVPAVVAPVGERLERKSGEQRPELVRIDRVAVAERPVRAEREQVIAGLELTQVDRCSGLRVVALPGDDARPARIELVEAPAGERQQPARPDLLAAAAASSARRRARPGTTWSTPKSATSSKGPGAIAFSTGVATKSAWMKRAQPGASSLARSSSGALASTPVYTSASRRAPSASSSVRRKRPLPQPTSRTRSRSPGRLASSPATRAKPRHGRVRTALHSAARSR